MFLIHRLPSPLIEGWPLVFAFPPLISVSEYPVQGKMSTHFSFAPGFLIHSWVYLFLISWLSLLFPDHVFVLFTDVKIGFFGFNPLYSPRYCMAKNKNNLRCRLGVVYLFAAIPLIQAWPSWNPILLFIFASLLKLVFSQSPAWRIRSWPSEGR